MVRLRPMHTDDLPLVREWLATPHVATWFLAGSSLEEELDDIRQSVEGEQETAMLVVLDDAAPIGWCQWYLCDVDPEWAHDVGARPGDAGIDYALGDASRVGHGVGTQLVAALVGVVRAAHPGCGIVADPDARNTASRRILEKNGFTLVRVSALPSERVGEPMAVYRLAASAHPAPATNV